MNRLLKYLEQQDKQLTVGDLIDKLNEKQEFDKQEELVRVNQYKSKYQNCYLKHKEYDSLWGKTLNIYHILSLGQHGKTTDWETFYSIEGYKIRFTSRDVMIKEIDPNVVYDSFTEVELDSMEFITKQENKKYTQKYKQIVNELKQILE
jgi:hypothetical protein